MRKVAMKRALTSESGFTIQELLVAIVAGSMLVGFSFSLYLFVARIVQKDVGRSEHRACVLKTVELIASDIGQSSWIELLTDSTLGLGTVSGRSIFYSRKQGSVFRNAFTLGPSEGERWSLHFQSSSDGRGGILILLKSSWKEDSLEAHVEAHIPQSSAVKFLTMRPSQGNPRLTSTFQH